MDLVKARKKAKEAGKEEQKVTAPAVPSPPAVPAAPAQAQAAPEPAPVAAPKPAAPAPAPKPAAPKPAAPPPPPEPSAPRSEPAAEDVFMDSAFGEDLPPMADFDADEDDSMVIAAAPSRPAKPAAKPAAKSAVAA